MRKGFVVLLALLAILAYAATVKGQSIHPIVETASADKRFVVFWYQPGNDVTQITYTRQRAQLTRIMYIDDAPLLKNPVFPNNPPPYDIMDVNLDGDLYYMDVKHSDGSITHFGPMKATTPIPTPVPTATPYRLNLPIIVNGSEFK